MNITEKLLSAAKAVVSADRDCELTDELINRLDEAIAAHEYRKGGVVSDAMVDRAISAAEVCGMNDVTESERDWREHADELLSAVPESIYDNNAWVREACDVMCKALAAHEYRKGGVVELPTSDDFGSWCNLLTHAWMYAQEGNMSNAFFGIEQVEKAMREWQHKLAHAIGDSHE